MSWPGIRWSVSSLGPPSACSGRLRMITRADGQTSARLRHDDSGRPRPSSLPALHKAASASSPAACWSLRACALQLSWMITQCVEPSSGSGDDRQFSGERAD